MSKTRRKKEIPERKVRPLSEILAKVRAEKNDGFIPRNIKLKHDFKQKFDINFIKIFFCIKF